jgi:hypothetical protein
VGDYYQRVFGIQTMLGVRTFLQNWLGGRDSNPVQ